MSTVSLSKMASLFAFGNKVKSLEFGIKANQTAEKSNNDRLKTFAKAISNTHEANITYFIS